MFPSVKVGITGERFSVVYRLAVTDEQAREKAEGICLEQSVELSSSMLPDGDIRDHVVGQLESLHELGTDSYEAVISYPVESTGFELVQFLNVVFSNISMKSGIRVERVELPASLLRHFPGPRFGRDGIRKLLGAPVRPLLGTAIKPVGYPPDELAKVAYHFALGGLDVIKDDHGLVDQPYARFSERAAKCAKAVKKANRETGGRSIYVPNISGPIDQIVDKAVYAKEIGAGGIEICPNWNNY